MTTRVLPVEEWPRLQATGCELPQLQDASTLGHVLVVEREGEIVGTALVMLCVHVEGLWIHPAHRQRAAIGRRLLIAITGAIRAFGATSAIASTAHTDVRRWLLTRFAATTLPGESFVMSTRGANG